MIAVGMTAAKLVFRIPVDADAGARAAIPIVGRACDERAEAAKGSATGPARRAGKLRG